MNSAVDKNIDDLKKVDWKVYLERQQSFTLFGAFVPVYNERLREVTGFGFKWQLQIFKDRTCTYYKSTAELAASDEYYLKLVEASDPRLKEWSDKGLEAGRIADQLVKKFSDHPETVSKQNFESIWNTCEEIFLYDTTVPYRILAAINSAIEAGQPEAKYQGSIELFDQFRKASRYPEIVRVVFAKLYADAQALLKIDDLELLTFMVPSEFRHLFMEGVHPDINELKQRQEWCAFWEGTKSGEMIFSYNSELFKDILPNQEVITKQDVIKGRPAYPGVVRGVVKIVNEIADVGKIEAGDILVSTHTNPGLMPAIIRCAAIVSDEGGITSHAAIVARELKKPCIIGTKIATKVLKDGDTVEVDADNGVVKILS